MEYFWGEDTYAAREAIAAVAEEQRATIDWVDRYDITDKPLTAWLTQSTGLFGKHLTVFLDASTWPKGLQEELAAHHPQPLLREEGSNAIIWDRLTKKDSVIFKHFKKQGKVFSSLPRPALRQWVIDLAHQHGASLTPPAAAVLVERVGDDRWHLKHEVSKLALTVKTITEAEVTQSVPANPSTTIFAALDAAAAGRGSEALRQLEILLNEGMSELYILTMIAYQFRTLLVIRAGLDHGVAAADIAAQAGLHPYVVQKNMAVAQRLSYDTLLAMLTRILAYDFSIKQGKVDARTALTMVVHTLTPLA